MFGRRRRRASAFRMKYSLRTFALSNTLRKLDFL